MAVSPSICAKQDVSIEGIEVIVAIGIIRAGINMGNLRKML